MSRAALVIALAKTMGRPPTDEERAQYLAELADLVGGEYVYIPKLDRDTRTQNAQIQAMRSHGETIRAIARKLQCSKSHVHDVLSANSPYVVDTKAG